MQISFSTQQLEGLSFDEAFAAAREEMGSSGIFYWQGQPYNTLTAAEEAGMSSSDWADFSHSIQSALAGHQADVFAPDNLAGGIQPDAPTDLVETWSAGDWEMPAAPPLAQLASAAPSDSFSFGDFFGSLLDSVFGD